MVGPLHLERWGADAAEHRLTLLHGFTQSGRAWAPVAELVASGPRPVSLVAPDLPGHGAAAEVTADLWATADLVAAAVEPSVVVGYSMGGRLALHLALRHPGTVTALVLVSATAGIDDAGDRARRRASDEALARRVESEGLEAFVRWWLTLPLFATLPAAAAQVEARLGGSAAGLASSLRLAGAGAQDDLWGRLGEVRVPTLVVTGALDTAYCERAVRLASSLGGPVDAVVLPGTGHACHLEAPEAFVDALGRWLGQQRWPGQAHTSSPTASSTPNTSTS